MPTTDGLWPRLLLLAEVLLLFAVFAVHGWLPAPAVNEAVYVAKAVAMWDRSLAPGDAYLNSEAAHVAFDVLFGWLGLFFSLETTTWIGRVVGWAALAGGWTYLTRQVAARPGAALWSGALFCALQKPYTMAGEWVVLTFEAKVLAWALVFVGVGHLVSGRWPRVWPWLGAAAALHVVVGGWALVAATGFLGVSWLRGSVRWDDWRSAARGFLIGSTLTLAGVIPAATAVSNAEPEVAAEASRIYVYERLPHHLYPPGFKPEQWRRTRHALLGCVWLAVAVLAGDRRTRRLHGYVVAALAITAAGFAIWGLTPDGSPAQASLLRFYWFRFSDAMMPAGLALGAVSLVCQWSAERIWLPALFVVATSGVWIADDLDDQTGRLGRTVPNQFQYAGRVKGTTARERLWTDWLEIAGRIDRELPADARFLNPADDQTFAWHARRGMVFNYKSMPQDPAGIVSWHARLLSLYGSRDRARSDPSLHRITPGWLRALGLRYAAGYLIETAEPLIDLPVVLKNDSFAVYKL